MTGPLDVEILRNGCAGHQACQMFATSTNSDTERIPSGRFFPRQLRGRRADYRDFWRKGRDQPPIAAATRRSSTVSMGWNVSR